MEKQPNILLIVSDEERRNDWLTGMAELPAHDRLRADGLTFNRYYTHSSPCSPSRASLYTGSYLAEHGVVDNVSFPAHTALDPAIPTIGSLLAENAYYSAYLGKWHLSHQHVPEMTAHGYQDYRGNDVHYTGSAWSGRFFDPVIAADAINWLREHGNDDKPWHLTVALVNPHDIMWFPIDHPSYQAAHPRDAKVFEFMRKMRLEGVPVEAMSEDYPERFSELPANFHDDLHSKPEIQRAWRQVRYYGIGGGIERDGNPAPTPKLFDVDAPFEDHDHEWYDTREDPLELVNLAHDRSRRDELRANFERLLEIESAAGV